jgi:ABC-type multidrug transport system fused ATPase/permease subunit
VFRTLGFAYWPYRYYIGLFLLIGFLGRLVILANSNIVGFWIDSFCKSTDSFQCRPLPGVFSEYRSADFLNLMLWVSLFGFIATVIFRVGFSRLSALAVSRLYDETTVRTSRYPMKFFDNTPVGRIVTRFSSDYGNIFRLFGGPLAEFFAILFDLISMVILVTIAHPIYLIPVLISGFLNYVIYRSNRDRLRALRRELSENRSPSIAHFAGTSQGASTIRSFVSERKFQQRFELLDFNFREKKMQTTKQVFLFSLQMNSLTALLFLLTAMVAVFVLLKGSVSPGALAAAISFVVLSGATVQMFFEWMAQFEEAMVGVERLDDYINKPLEKFAVLPAGVQFQTPTKIYTPAEQQSIFQQMQKWPKALPISFENVWFKYSGDLPYVLKDLSFNVKAGEKLGIIGKTGSGKSSIIQTLFSLYPIEKGSIKISDHHPGNTDLNLYRSLISYISQDPVCFQGTLRDNLSLKWEQTDEELISALRIVGLGHFATPEGLGYLIEEKGRNLSMGERQLISLARTLLQKSPIVVFDEATSSIDPQSEEILVKATDDFFEGKTRIIIAHRLSTLKICDRVLWLKEGKCYRLGPAAEIIKEFETDGRTGRKI